MLLSSNKALFICMVFPPKKKKKQLAITARAREIITSPYGVSCPNACIYGFVWNPRLELHHQERPHESSQVKHKAVRAAVGNHIPSSFFVPSLWMCRGHEIGPQCIQLHFVHENPKGAFCCSTVRRWKLLLFECVSHICCIWARTAERAHVTC